MVWIQILCFFRPIGLQKQNFNFRMASERLYPVMLNASSAHISTYCFPPI